MNETGTQNRLAREKSPYLLQHAENPVNWYPWGEEAFNVAREMDRPIFLSIGYSTCHWCHVMAHESFEDPDVARLLNQSFVNIKVDREERPDIDKLYMDVCVNMTGSGGWPLTIIMTPEKKPFFAATYIPKESRFGMVGIMELVHRISDIWTHQRSRVIATADKIIQVLQENTKGTAAKDSGLGNQKTLINERMQNNSTAENISPFDHENNDVDNGQEIILWNGKYILQRAFLTFTQTFDPEYGGFGNAPKFPSPHDLQFLMNQYFRTGDPLSLEIVMKTLDSMRFGGIYDHIGYGFHRYSTDREWLVPHFEKMLYDQAMLLMAFTDAYQITCKIEYRRTIMEIIEYTSCVMTSPLGGFYSAEDADSEGEEGKYYLWTIEEIQNILSKDDAGIAFKLFNMERSGNFVDPVTRVRNGDNILHLTRSLQELAQEFGIALPEFEGTLQRIREMLHEVRETRTHPHKDDKVLTDWNGLMIAALARAGRVLASPGVQNVIQETGRDNDNHAIDPLKMAMKAFAFIWNTMRSDGILLHRYRKGDAAISGNLDDHAFLIRAALELYRSTFDIEYLEKALWMNDVVIREFLDPDQGGFFFTLKDNELPVRRKELRDAAIPSGNSIQLGNLMILSSITGRHDLEGHAHDMIRAFSAEINRSPHAQSCFLLGLGLAMNDTNEIVVVGDTDSQDSREMLDIIRMIYLPDSTVVFISQNAENLDNDLYRIAPYLEQYTMIRGKATAYVCKNHSCQRPVNDPDELKELLFSMNKILHPDTISPSSL